jgi:hypothetical protein
MVDGHHIPLHPASPVVAHPFDPAQGRRFRGERDLIRQRDWEYAVSTAFLSDEGLEALRRKVVAEYGEGLELIDPT